MAGEFISRSKRHLREGSSTGDACALADHPRGALVIYQAPDGRVELEIRLEQEDLWLSINQIAALFERDRSVISRHLHNVFKEGELEHEAIYAKYAQVRSEGERQVSREIELYNLDAIISVGYRVSSKRGTQFRIWATRVLRAHLLQGYTFNQRRLKELNQAVALITETANRRDISGDEAKALLAIVGDYNRALESLDDYDHKRVGRSLACGTVTHHLGYEEALRIVDRLRSSFNKSSVFGVAIDKGLESARVRSCKPQTELRSTPASKRRPPKCSTWWSKITPSLMARANCGSALPLVSKPGVAH